jgi:hypothetical protein
MQFQLRFLPPYRMFQCLLEKQLMQLQSMSRKRQPVMRRA